MALFPASVVAVLDSWGVTSNQLGQQEVELLTQILACQTVIAGNGGGGGGSLGELPVWTFDSGTGGNPASGKFQLDNTDPSAASNIYFHKTQKNGGLDLDDLFAYGANARLIVLTNLATGQCVFVESSSPGAVLIGDVVTIPIGLGNADSSPLSGDFAVSFAPQNAPAPPLAAVLGASSIIPVADGTYFGIQFVGGVAVSAATPQADGTITPVTSGTIGSGGALLNLS